MAAGLKAASDLRRLAPGSGRKCFSPEGSVKFVEGRLGRSQPHAGRQGLRQSAVVSSLGKFSDVGRDLAAFDRDLAVGDSGEDVRGLRTLMRHMGYIHAPPDPSDDSFFDITLKEAVQAWQADHSLPSSGYFGPMSRELLVGQQEGVGIVSAVTGGHPAASASPSGRQAAKRLSATAWPIIKSQSTAYHTSTVPRPPTSTAVSPQVITSVAVIIAAGLGAVIARSLNSQTGLNSGQEDPAAASPRPPKPRLSLSSAARARVNGAMQAARSGVQPTVAGASSKKKAAGDAPASPGWGLQPLVGLGMAALSSLASPLKGIFAPKGDKAKSPASKGGVAPAGAAGARPRIEKRSLASEFEAQVDGKSRLADIPSKVALGIVEKCLEELEMKEYEMQDRLRAMEDRMMGMEGQLEGGARTAPGAAPYQPAVEASLAQAEKLIAGLQTRLSRTEAALADATERGYDRGQALNDRLMAIEGALNDVVPLVRSQIAELQRKVGAGGSTSRSLVAADALVLDDVAERVDLALNALTTLEARVRSVEEAPRGGTPTSAKAVVALESRVASVEEHLGREMEEAMHKLDVVAEVVEEVARLSKEQQDTIARSPPAMLATVTGDIVKRLEAVEGRVSTLDRMAGTSGGLETIKTSYAKDMAELRGRVGELEEALEAAMESMDAAGAMDVIAVLERKVEELEASVGNSKAGGDPAGANAADSRKEEKAV